MTFLKKAAAHGRLIRVALPGLLLCAAISLTGGGLQMLQVDLFGRFWLESLVMAILIGAAVRFFWTPGPHFHAGISISGKLLLEIAIVLLGASISAQKIAAAGPGLLAGIPLVVALALGISYGVSRLIGLSHRMATLVACGNSICGNSAIVAVAPVIGAKGEDIAASIAFTAVLGVIVVLALPLAGHALNLDVLQYGALAGLTVYAVPQVLAAAAPLGATAIQIGTLVKLLRVLMLGPVCLVLSFVRHAEGEAAPQFKWRTVHRLVPWFIIGFLLCIVIHSAGFIPHAAERPIARTTDYLTVMSMAALGLGTDVRAVARAGARISLAASVSIVALGAIGFALIRLLAI